MNKFILDACALIALQKNEDGAKLVDGIVGSADEGRCEVYMHLLNLLEAYYGYIREDGQEIADQQLRLAQAHEIQFIPGLSKKVFSLAAQLKAKYKISLADSIVLAQGKALNASIVTADHHEMDAIEETEGIAFSWYR